MARVMIVDDQPTARKILEEIVDSLGPKIDVHCFADPREALRWASSHAPDLVLTDYLMPKMNGAELTARLRLLRSCSDIPVIVVTGLEERAVRYRALEAGATDFLTKPVDYFECRARCRNLLALRHQQQIIKERAGWLESKVQEAIEEVAQREAETLLRLARAGEYRDEGTGNHVIRMARFSRIIADNLGIADEECDVIERAAPMHDIGKIGIPDQVLLKPHRLSAQEWRVMQMHSAIGYEILRDSPSKYLQTGAIIAQCHHERYDGRGYPDGLAGEEIPLNARIVTVADVYDALTSQRPYKQAWPMNKAVCYLKTQRGHQFDPSCVDAFLESPAPLESHLASMQVDETAGGCRLTWETAVEPLAFEKFIRESMAGALLRLHEMVGG